MSSESLRASANSDTALFYVREKEWLLAENFKNCSDLGTFKRMSNSAVTPLPTSGCIATNESFQMRYLMEFHRNKKRTSLDLFTLPLGNSDATEPGCHLMYFI